jgi:hypothetical protein
MPRTRRLSKLAPWGCVAAAMMVSSCALPPKQAWQKIRNDGLISYISYEMRTPRRPLDAPGPVQPLGPASKPAMAPLPTLVAKKTAVKEREPTVVADASPTTPSDGALTAVNVPSLPGYVRSPYTNPPRLVDVKGAVAGSTMICPYTQKPFIVPAAPGPSPTLQLANRSPERKASSTSPKTVAAEETAETAPKQAAPLPESKPTPNPSPNSTPAPAPAKDMAANSNPAPSSAPTLQNPPVQTPPAPAPVPEIPYGSPVVGRPGYVNSPHAQAHQLVDVSGLPVGMQVKCPYTGKLFRVPPQDMASNRPAPTATSPDSDPAKK